MIVLAVTLHNIPEGMAVGLAFSMAAQDTGSGALAGAVALAIGMGLQNFPEGAAISLPLRSDGVGTGRAFAAGALSGVVEPIFGLLTVLVAGSVTPGDALDPVLRRRRHDLRGGGGADPRGPAGRSIPTRAPPASCAASW